jgi:hypothetical protein
VEDDPVGVFGHQLRVQLLLAGEEHAVFALHSDDRAA